MILRAKKYLAEKLELKFAIELKVFNEVSLQWFFLQALRFSTDTAR